MPTRLSFERHLAIAAEAGRQVIEVAVQAGFDAAVPTCPTWTVAHLVAHQTMVHRWVTAHVAGSDPEAVPNQTDIRESVVDLDGYYRDGLASMLAALRDAPADLEAMVFLNDAPPPRSFWARRQAHENTIHLVDTRSALGPIGPPDALGIDRELALDGIDELLCGFYTRGRSKLFDGTAFTVGVAPTDAEAGWVLEVGERMTARRLDVAPPAMDVTLAGTAVELYVGLWNRSGGIAESGRPGLLERWRSSQRVRWS